MEKRTIGRLVTGLLLVTTAGLGAGIASQTLAGSDDPRPRGAESYETPVGSGAGDRSLTVEEIRARVEAERFTDIRKIERERGVFEVKARDGDGRRVELYVDAVTGEIVKHELED